MNITFDSEPINDKYIKAKIKSYGDKCLSLIMLDSVIRANKKYYPQTLLEECKFQMKNNKMENLINK